MESVSASRLQPRSTTHLPGRRARKARSKGGADSSDPPGSRTPGAATGAAGSGRAGTWAAGAATAAEPGTWRRRATSPDTNASTPRT